MVYFSILTHLEHPLPALDLAPFQAAVSLLGGGRAADLHLQLRICWAEPHRRYHTLQHLAECLTLARDWGAGLPAADQAILTLALWFHDAVYDTRAKDNEYRSAALAETELARLGIAYDDCAHVAQLVLATEHSTPVPPGNLLVDLLLDVDLAILAAPAPRFNEYEAQVRAEYGWVEEGAYQEGRGKVMAHFRGLATAEPSPLYRTAAGRTLLAQARANLGVSE
jgi:predicted metal-dependent HD superfamily phosphohydrolase